MYKIMTLDKTTKSATPLYKFLTVSDADGTKVDFVAETEKELETQVEKMLNGKYAKSDFIVVTVKDYTLDTDLGKTDISTPATGEVGGGMTDMPEMPQ